MPNSAAAPARANGNRGFHRSPSPFPIRNKRVPGIGPVPARCMFIGERPGADESRVGRPFVGPSGRVMDTYLEAANVSRESLYITNLVKTFRDYAKPTAQDIAEDHDELIAEISIVNPEVIGLVGAYAVTGVLGTEKAELEKCHGVPVRVQSLFGGEIAGNWIVLPMYHPANAYHAPEMSPSVLDDFLRLGQLLDGEMQPIENRITHPEYELLRDTRSLLAIIEDHDWISIDTEFSPNGRTWSAQISCAYGSGYMIRADESKRSRDLFEALNSWLCRTRPLVILHNSLADLDKLRQVGIDIVADEIPFIDTMVLAYLLCCEPQGLKPLAYRWSGMEMQDYSEVLGDVGYHIAMEYLGKVMETEWPEPEPEIITEGGRQRVKKPQGVNKLVKRILADVKSKKVLKDGSTTDPRERWKKLNDAAKTPVIAAMGDMRIPDLGDIDERVAIDYGCRDADATGRIYPHLAEKIKVIELEQVAELDHSLLPMVDRMQEVGIQLAGVEFWDKLEAKCQRQMDKASWAVYQILGREINIGSDDQVAEVLYGPKSAGGMGLIPPSMTESGKRGSVKAVCLEDLLDQSPMIQHVMDYGEAQKIKGTYIEPLRALCQQGDGRAHSTIRITRTTTGRLSMADPPLHQIPIMTDLGREIRDGFIAPEGKVLASYDFSHLEMRMCAHDSRDPELMRMFWEDRDIHAETACKIFSVPMSALSVDNRGKVNDVRRTVAKHCIAAGQLVLTDQGLVPIEKITLQHKLWDGVEWVSHEGVIDQGLREVIEHDGLTATPDHRVVTEKGTIEDFGQVASALGRLHATGSGRQEIRTGYRNLLETSARERIHQAESEMYQVWQHQLEVSGQSDQSDYRMQTLRDAEIPLPENSRSTLRRYRTALQQTALSGLRGLWCQRHQVSVLFPYQVCAVGSEKSAASYLSRCDDRSDRQRRSLRAGEFKTCYPIGAEPEPAQYPENEVSWKRYLRTRVRQSLRTVLDLAAGQRTAHDGRTDYSECHSQSATGKAFENVETTYRVVKVARVYDIVNAGPRRCFTVSGKLVLNCAFGIINGITPSGVVNYLIMNHCRRPDGERWTLDDCEMLLREWFNIYKGVKRFQEDCIAETRMTGLARETVCGRVIYLPQIWSPDKQTRETAERMSYVMHTQSGGQAIVKRAMREVWQQLCKFREFKIDCLFQMHDELIFELPDDEPLKSMLDITAKQIYSKTTKLRVPVLCSGGFGHSWLEAH